MTKIKLVNRVAIAALISTLTACGGGGDDNPEPSNTAPVAQDASFSSIQDQAKNFMLTASDADGDPLTYSIVDQTLNGTLTLSSDTINYIPTSGFSGSDSFTFKVNDGTEDSPSAQVNITINPTASVLGVIQKINGDRVDNVTVDILDSAGNTLPTVTSSSNGEFQVTSKTGSKLILSFTKTGFAKQTSVVLSPDIKDFNVPMNITLLESGAIQSVDISNEAMVTGENGASVNFPANSFIDASGNLVTGNIDVVITPVDVSDPNTLAAFPGQFLGMPESSAGQVALVSAGTTYFEFSQGGEKLQLADDVSAEIQLPIFVTDNPVTGNPIELGDSIELWYLDESTGVWVQEGTGTVVVNTSSPTGYALKATVDHFTPYNVDFPIPLDDFATLDITINGTVNGGIGKVKFRRNPAIGWGTGLIYMHIGETATFPFLASNGDVCIYIEYIDNTNSAATSPEQCITNPVASAAYALTFNVATAGSLNLHDSYYPNTYRINQNANIYFAPQTLENAVTYTITSGSLPTGMTLASYNATSAKIIGSSTILGSYTITVEGIDSDGFTDSKTISFDIVNPPAPQLYSTSYIHLNMSDSVTEDLSSRVVNNTTAPTTWTITESDGSAVASNVSISSSGLLTISNYDGVDTIYKVASYNIYGASNTMDLDVSTIGAPILNSSHTIMYFMDDFSSYTEQLSVTGASAAATSWSITNNDGTATDPTQISINNSGDVTYDNSNAFLYDTLQFKVTAMNAIGSSNTMTIHFQEVMIFDPCAGDPLCNP